MALFACLIGLSGCSGDDGIRVVSTNISGPLGEYYEVVDKNYKATVEEGMFKYVSINIEIKRVKEGGPTEDGSRQCPRIPQQMPMNYFKSLLISIIN